MGQIIFSARLIVRHRTSFQIKIYQLNKYAYDVLLHMRFHVVSVTI